MAVGALVERVGAVLGRAHALFGDPPESGGVAAASAGSRVAGAGDLVGAAQARIAALSGDFATGYGLFARGAGPALDRLAGTDGGLGGQLDEAAGSDLSGRSASGAVIDGAAADTAGLGPVSNTPAGERALIAVLRSRLAEQRRLVAAYRLRNARMAALLRSLAYPRGGGIPRSGFGMPSGGGGFDGAISRGGGLPLSLPSMPGLGARCHTPRTALIGRRVGRGDVPDGPGAFAAEAALSRRGSPYAWGAKGPSSFDCSGLTQWSWAKAGVRLGADTYSQLSEGVPVLPGEVRAGDLIFPTSSFGEGGRPGPGHVQLAISPTEVVHAPQSGDVVRVAPMPTSFVARRPVPGS